MRLTTLSHYKIATSSSETEHFCHKRCIISSPSSQDRDLSALHAIISPIFFAMSRHGDIPEAAAFPRYSDDLCRGVCCRLLLLMLILRSGYEPRAQGIVLRPVSINCLLKTSESSDSALSTPCRSGEVRRSLIMRPESQGQRRMSGGWS